MPRKVSIAPSEASEVVEQLRAFYTFLKRELSLEQADACLELLDGDAVRDLRTLLSEQTNYGPVKSFFTEGQKAGFDMSTEKGRNAWMRVVESRGLPLSGAAPRTRSPKAAQEKKKQRKAERKARKKNRR